MPKSKKNENYLFYNIISKLIVFLGNLYFGGKVIGQENIKKGKCLLAGNHTSIFDSYLLFKSTKRPIHILGKKELFDGPFGFIFKGMHLIRVDRQNKKHHVKEEVGELLNHDKIVAIFPEGTFHKESLILPFKPGVIAFGEEYKTPIVPFAIVGKFKFRSHPQIIFGKSIFLDQVKEEDKVKYLEDIVKNLIIKNQ